MKRSLIISFSLAAVISCGQAGFQVDGTYTAPDGTEVYLIDMNSQDTLDVTRVKDNSFAFNGKLSDPSSSPVRSMSTSMNVRNPERRWWIPITRSAIGSIPWTGFGMQSGRN